MRINNLNDLLVDQLKDLYNAESQVTEAYRRWSDEATTSDLKRLYDRYLTQIDTHKRRITQICGGLGVSPEGEKCKGMEGLIREGDDFLQEAGEGAVRDAGLLAMSQRIEHYGMAGYGCARTYALQLGYDNAAEQLQQILEEEAQFDERMTRLAQQTINAQAAEAEVEA
jgi:ferritin-like metal-binding protein YciE